MNTPLRLGLYALVVLAQLYVPVSMIRSKEAVLTKGTVIKMKTAPVDPYDPFRGRYVALSFEQTQFTLDRRVTMPSSKRNAYIVLENDAEGFAEVVDVVFDEPDGGLYYEAKVTGKASYEGKTHLTLYHPFNRYYMEEHAAPEAERVYRGIQGDESVVAYVTVRLYKGQAVLEELYLGDVPAWQIDENSESHSPTTQPVAL